MKQTNETITADGGWSIKFELNAEDADASSSLGMKVNTLHPERSRRAAVSAKSAVKYKRNYDSRD